MVSLNNVHSLTSAILATALFSNLLASRVSAHLIMATPKPFGGDSLDNSPLRSDGSNFPCKSTGSADFYKVDGLDNQMAIGEEQTLSFKGSAAHGGGSCQLALTEDMAPTASSVWKVILSIEGGCPTKGQGGPDTYPFKIPDGIKPGKYVFGWTWISKLAGQPEYYMNCAPVTVIGGASKRSDILTNITERADVFPDLFVANLASINSCKVGPSVDPEYPEPGPNVERPEGQRTYQKPTGTDCFPKGGGSSGDGSSNNGSMETSSNVVSSAPPPNDASGAVPSPSGGSFQEGVPSRSDSGSDLSNGNSSEASSAVTETNSNAGASTGASTSSSSQIATPIVPSTLQTSAATSPSSPAFEPGQPAPGPTGAPTQSTTAPPSPTGTGSSGGYSSAGNLSGPCTSEGAWNCISGVSFQRCASGSWSAIQPMPAGVQCTSGPPSQNLGITRRGMKGYRWIKK